MARLGVKRIALTAVVVMAAAGTSVLAQGVLAQLGQTEASAKELVLKAVEYGRSSSASELIAAARKAYAKLPPASRGPVTTGFYAWTKAYVSSAEFKSAYAKRRADSTPQPVQHNGTVEQELKAGIDAETKQLEDGMKQTLAILPAAERAKTEAEFKQTIAALRSPEAVKQKRQELEEQRAKEKADLDMLTEKWRNDFPADHNTLIAWHLRNFVDATVDVDFAAKGKMVPGEAGPVFSFDNAAYNKKPWQWHECYQAGPEATSAARAAAQAWLKELGR
jgi:hypothetical protein